MSTQPEPDYRIAVVLATERGRTAVVALISDLTGPVDTVILERTPKSTPSFWSGRPSIAASRPLPVGLGITPSTSDGAWSCR